METLFDNKDAPTLDEVLEDTGDARALPLGDGNEPTRVEQENALEEPLLPLNDEESQEILGADE